jgi:hypothetical protein
MTDRYTKHLRPLTEEQIGRMIAMKLENAVPNEPWCTRCGGQRFKAYPGDGFSMLYEYLCCECGWVLKLDPLTEWLR